MFRVFVTFATFGVAANFAASLLLIKFYSEASEWWYGLPIVSPNVAAESWLILGTLYLGHAILLGFLAGIIAATSLGETLHLRSGRVALAVAVSLVGVNVLAVLVVPAFNILRQPLEDLAKSYLLHVAVSGPSAAIAGLVSQWWINRMTT